MFLVHILSAPALIYQIEANITETLQIFQTHSILERSLDLLEKEQNMKIITNSMKGTQSLALLANLVHLFHLEAIETAMKFGFPTFTVSKRNKVILFKSISLQWGFFFSVCMYETLAKYTEFGGPKRRNIFAMA